MGKRLTKEVFIERARKIHGDKYDYSKVEYTDSTTKVCIICPEHGEFWQVPSSHLRGIGCSICGHNSLTDENFIIEARKIHGDKYDYSKINLRNKDGKLCIICPEHGEFWQYKYDHLKRKRGCLVCGGSKRLTTEEFIERAKKVHGDKYDYSKVEYKSAHEKVCIICPKHGEFWQEPDNHLRWGCPKCRESVLEIEIRNFLIENNIEFEEQKKFTWLKDDGSLKLDFFIPKKNIAIECQGEQHFERFRFEKNDDNLEKRIKRDELKLKLCMEHNIKILYFGRKKEIDKIPENGYYDKELLKKELI